MEINNATMEGFVELFGIYGRSLQQLSDLWRGLAVEEAEEVPPEVWLLDASAAEQLAQVLTSATEDLQTIWATVPVDLRETLNIKIKKVKKLND